MKKILLYAVCIAVALISVFSMFALKYQVKLKEKRLKNLVFQIQENNRDIRVLKAEWTNLTTPKRIRALVQEKTDLKTMKPKQVIEWKDIPSKKERKSL